MNVLWKLLFKRARKMTASAGGSIAGVVAAWFIGQGVDFPPEQTAQLAAGLAAVLGGGLAYAAKNVED